MTQLKPIMVSRPGISDVRIKFPDKNFQFFFKILFHSVTALTINHECVENKTSIDFKTDHLGNMNLSGRKHVHHCY